MKNAAAPNSGIVWIWIGSIILLALVVAFFLIYPQLKPLAAIQPATREARPNVNRNSTGDPNAPGQAGRIF